MNHGLTCHSKKLSDDKFDARLSLLLVTAIEDIEDTCSADVDQQFGYGIDLMKRHGQTAHVANGRS